MSDTGSEEQVTPEEPDKYRLILTSNPAFLNAALIISFCLIPLAFVILWFIWFIILPAVWSWTFDTFSWRILPGIIGIFFIAFLPVWVPVVAFKVVAWMLEIYADESTKKVRQVFERGSSLQSNVEDELAKQDQSGLVPLLRYSRVQLESYYAIGLTQTQRSFRYSIVAMWIGFAVILGGIIIRVIDLSHFGLRPLDTDMSNLIIVSGAIIEVISALFLWVYRSSVRQLTYFYNRQMYNHSILMSQRIADTMTNADEIKKIIIEKLLDRSWSFEMDGLPSGQSLLSFRK
jgi:hypothetical protein